AMPMLPIVTATAAHNLTSNRRARWMPLDETDCARARAKLNIDATPDRRSHCLGARRYADPFYPRFIGRTRGGRVRCAACIDCGTASRGCMALRRSGGIGIHCGQYDPFLDSASRRPTFYVGGHS